MGSHKTCLDPVKLFCGIILSPALDFSGVKAVLEGRFGPVDYASPAMDFCKYTTYYNPEMGEGLKRLFISFEKLIDRALLPDIKKEAIEIEKDFSLQGKRRVNLDPGCMGLGQLFLASTKDNFFRIYIRDGVFEEVTLYYERGKFMTFPWTYRDYASEEYHKVFQEIRDLYKIQIRPL
jgi:hypothetical protein